MRLGERDSRSPHGWLSPPESPELGSFGGSVVPVPPTSLKPEILRLRRDGLTVREIAQRLNLRFSEVRQLLDISSEGYIEFEGFECLDFTTSESSSKALEYSQDDLDELTSASDWDLSELLDIQHGFDTGLDNILQTEKQGRLCSISHPLELRKFDDYVEGVVNDYTSVVENVLRSHEAFRKYLEFKGQIVLSEVGRGFRGLRDVVDDSWLLCDLDFGRYEYHEVVYDLLKEFGYSEGDLSSVVRFRVGECRVCNIRYANGYKVHSGRMGIVRKYNEAKRRAIELFEILKLIGRKMDDFGIYNFRKNRNGEMVKKPCSHKSLAIIWVDLTVSDEISKAVADFICQRFNESRYVYGFGGIGSLRGGVRFRIESYVFSEVRKIVKVATEKALKQWLRDYLSKVEHMPLIGDFEIVGFSNIHLWSSLQLSPHLHNHLCLFNVVEVEIDGKREYWRFSPKIRKDEVERFKKIWCKVIVEEIRKADFWKVWGYDELLFDKLREIGFKFDVHFSYTWLKDKCAGVFVHHIAYRGRSFVVDLNNAFWDCRVVRDQLDLNWIEACLLFINKRILYGSMKRWRKRFNISNDELKALWQRLRENRGLGYCPFCGNPLEFIGVYSLNELLDSFGKVVFYFYFKGLWRFEFWKKKGRGGGLNG